MTGCIDLCKREELSDEQALDILLDAVKPGYRSKEKIHQYVRDRFNKEIKNVKLTRKEVDELAELIGYDKAEFRERLDGKRQITKEFISHFCMSLGLGVNEVLPFDYDLTKKKYIDIHKRLIGRMPAKEFDSSGIAPLVVLLENYAFR